MPVATPSLLAAAVNPAHRTKSLSIVTWCEATLGSTRLHFDWYGFQTVSVNISYDFDVLGRVNCNTCNSVKYFLSSFEKRVYCILFVFSYYFEASFPP